MHNFGKSDLKLLNRPLVILGAACAIAVLIYGPRSALGLFTNPVTETYGWGRDVFALGIALQQIVWGLAQPIAGALADRFGARRIIVIGALIYASGFALMPHADTPATFHLSAGVLLGLGLAATGFPVVVAALGRLMPPQHRSLALGLVTASGSVGQFLFAPFGQVFITTYGWPVALWAMAVLVLFVIVLSLPLGADQGRVNDSSNANLGFVKAVAAAFAHRSYVLLVTGFFVCGFHVAFVMVHFPPYLSDIGISSSLAAWALGLIGFFNIFGAFAAGYLGDRYSKRYLLSALYLARALLIAIFLIVDKSPIAVAMFAAGLGLLWLSTVPLTSGLVAVMVGTRYLGTLYGFVFLSHQTGAFVGVWLGGYLYERTGSYDLMWQLGIGLALFAAMLHWPIREQRAAAFADRPDLIRGQT